jgi:hypothetical protein
MGKEGGGGVALSHLYQLPPHPKSRYTAILQPEDWSYNPKISGINFL